MADDYSGNASTTGRIAPSGTVTGTLEVPGDNDWFATSFQAGYVYQFNLSGTTTTVDPTHLNVAVVNSSGVAVAGSLNSSKQTLTYAPNASGTYYVDVNALSYPGDTVGGYTLTENPQDDFTGTLATTGSLSPGQVLAAGLQAYGDSDWLAVSLTAGYNYQFAVAGTTTTVDPNNLNVALLNGSGNAVAGSINGTNKSISFTPTTSGTYYVDVNSLAYPGDTIGGYLVSQSAQDDYTANAATTGHLTGTSIAGTLEGANDVDWISVQLTAGSAYQFTIAGTTSTVAPTGLNLALLNQTGVVQAGGGSTTKSVSFTPTSSGTYYLQASSLYGASTGSYVISQATTGSGSSTGGGGSTGGGSTGGGSTGGGSGAGTATVPVYRFFDTVYGTHFFTSDNAEYNTILATRPDLKNEGVGLQAASSSDPNASPVYRFFDSLFGTHFFTSDAAERDTILNTRPDLKFEGVGFYEYKTQQANTTSVLRYFDTIHGTHFFSSSASEQSVIAATRPDLKPEGIAFYSPS